MKKKEKEWTEDWTFEEARAVIMVLTILREPYCEKVRPILYECLADALKAIESSRR